MTRETDELSRERHLVVVFDICSSTTILEDLKRTDNLGAWRNVLIFLKDYLAEKGRPLKMDLYKFIGDGWVLLFPNSVPKAELCVFLSDLSKAYEAEFGATIRPLLSQDPDPVGLMFGIDAGELIRMVLGNQIEYVGRAINVASRLQSYTKELPGGPSYKVIFSKNSYNSPAPPPAGLIAVEPIKVSLRNISPATIQCFAWQTTELKTPAPKPASAPSAPRSEQSKPGWMRAYESSLPKGPRRDMPTDVAAAMPVEAPKIEVAKPARADRAPTAAVGALRSLGEQPLPLAANAAPDVVQRAKAVPVSMTAPTARMKAAPVKKPGLNIQVSDLRQVEMAALLPLGKWTLHRNGQPGVVVQFTNEAEKTAKTAQSASGAGVVAQAHLIYRDGEDELLRVKGAWLDGYDVARFNANDTRGLVLGVGGASGFSALEAVRTNVNGSERVEVRPSRFAAIPPKMTVLVQLTDANGRDVLYEGEFEVKTDPLGIARISQ